MAGPGVSTQRREARKRWFAERRGRETEESAYWLGRAVVDLFARATLRADLQWRAPLPDGPKILAANHPTTTDPFLIMLLASEQVSVLVTEECFRVPVFGRILLASGHVPVVRQGGGVTVEAALRLLAEGRTVAIFPEGAISPAEGGVHRPHSGVARLAVGSGAPVIPVGIGVDRGRIRRFEADVGGERETVSWYSGGPYATTVGRAMWFWGDVNDWGYVRSVAEQITRRIAGLARESDRRVEQEAVLQAPARVRPAGAG
jgi:1-acyl-sn-glycerol-3-phosphate acyltransferase